jgi:hypothetical protein
MRALRVVSCRTLHVVGVGWSHVAYADESNWNIGRYRSVAIVTAPTGERDRIVNLCSDLLTQSSVSELSWKDVTGARERFAAQKIIGTVINEATAGWLRVDVLMWDMTDARHANVRKRDDVANLGRMYHHLVASVLGNRWPAGSTWSLHPDEHSQLDWSTLKEVLDARGKRLSPEPGLDSLRELTETFRVVQLVPRESHTNPLIQVADLFAGMMPYSHDRYDDYERWLPTSGGQATLAGVGGPAATMSGSDAERFVVLRSLREACRAAKLYVSLESNRGLISMKPELPVNFWRYRAQSEEDRAPTRPPRWFWRRKR